MFNMKSVFAALLAAAALSAGASAAFTRSVPYPGAFTDVSADAWYASTVKDAYEFGLMKGESDITFNPEGNLSVAEGITVAARIYETLTGKAIGTADGEWYTPYVNYAVSNGIMTKDTFDSFDRAITRAEMASLFEAVCGDMPAINHVTALPDVSSVTPTGKKILALYNAGILTGNDDYGTFKPDTNLTRAELAAMSVRIADESKRVKKNFAPLTATEYGDAYYMIDNISGTGRNNRSIANGWNYDNRFEFTNLTGTDKKYVYDADNTTFTALIRDFHPETEGSFRLEMAIDVWSKDGGVYVTFENANEDRLFGLTEVGGKWALTGLGEVVTDAECTGTLKTYAINFDFDLNTGVASATIDNKYVGAVAIPTGVTIERLVLGTNEIGTGSVNISHVKLYKNYAVNDRFMIPATEMGKKPYGYDIDGDFNLQRTVGQVGTDVYSVKANTKAGNTSTASRKFAPVSGNVNVQTFMLFPKAVNGASFSILSAGKSVITVETKGNTFYVGDKALKEFHDNVWQNVRIEADTKKHTAVIKIDDKVVGEAPFEADSFDEVLYTFAPDKDAIMWFDDLVIYCLHEHEDYPSYPQVASSDDYNIGMHFCWLWRDTVSGEGWDSVSPFPEFEPTLGYFDEGTREAADWEIKYLAEHGIDFINCCWFAPYTYMSEPIKQEQVSYEAFHEGYMNAKYSDLVKFSLIWECNYMGCRDFNGFRDIIWNYWKDYYFSDERYMRLDNKALITVFGSPESCFSSPEEAAKAFAWCEEDIKSLGYDGIILLYCNNYYQSDDYYAHLNEGGVDGTYAYSWGVPGNNADWQVQIMTGLWDESHKNGSHAVPVISVGYNDVGRNDRRNPMISVPEHKRVCDYTKTLLDQSNTGTWKDNTLFISTWNEISEGTQVIPTAGNGVFGYLDNVRTTFTSSKETDHSAVDTPLTEAQKERITKLYPTHHTPIRWFMYEKPELDTTGLAGLVPVLTYDMTTEEGLNGWKQGHGLTAYNEGNGVISGTCGGNDSSVASDGISFNAEDVDVMHFKLKTSVNSFIQIYFATDTSPNLGEDKKATADHLSAGEYNDYYIRMSDIPTWKGKITSIRFDALNDPGDFEISFIEFMSDRSDELPPIPTIIANGNKMDFIFNPVALDNGDVEVVGEAMYRGFYSTLRVYHEWDRFDGKLTLKTRDKRTIVFTVDSDKYTVDGEFFDLGYTFCLRDGLPVFHIKQLCDILGYKYTDEDRVITIQAGSDEELAVLAEQGNKLDWDFSTISEIGDWKTRQCSISVGSDGCLALISAGDDPSITHEADFYNDEYTHCIIGMKNTPELAECRYDLFIFGYDENDKYTMAEYYGDYPVEGVAEGDTVEVVIDLRTLKEYVNGLHVSNVRLDPLSKLYTLYIRYIRFINDGSVAPEVINADEEEPVVEEVEIVAEEGDPVIEIGSDDIVNSKYGILLCETTFDDAAAISTGTGAAATVKPSYLNTKYVKNMQIDAYTADSILSAELVEGTSITAKRSGLVFDTVPNGTGVHRISAACTGLNLIKGTYILTFDAYIPNGASLPGIFRMDTYIEGDNLAGICGTEQGKWHTFVTTVKVLSVEDGKATINVFGKTATVDASGFAGNLWVIKSGESTDDHYYYDNFRLYYQPVGFEPSEEEPIEEEEIFAEDSETNYEAPIYVPTEGEIFDEELGILIGEQAFDVSNGLAVELTGGGAMAHTDDTYINTDYMKSLVLETYSLVSSELLNGAKAPEKRDGFVLDAVTNGNAVSRLALGFKGITLQTGTYTIALDVYVPNGGSEYYYFRPDTFFEGSNLATEINVNRGTWHTVKIPLQVLRVSGGKAVIRYAGKTDTVDAAGFTGAHIWFAKTSGSVTEHIYFDNVRVYFMPGEGGEITEPEEAKPATNVTDETATDKKYGTLLGEIAFDADGLPSDIPYGENGALGHVDATTIRSGAMKAMSLDTISSASIVRNGIVNGENLAAAREGYVLDVVPKGTEVHRIAVNFTDMQWEKGSYTLTYDIFLPADNAACSTVRMDIVGMDVEASSQVNAHSGSWTTVEVDFTVTDVKDGEASVTCAGHTGTLGRNFVGNLWYVKVSGSEDEHIYYDNFRLYRK